jgi:hypothetical protein
MCWCVVAFRERGLSECRKVKADLTETAQGNEAGRPKKGAECRSKDGEKS